MANRANQFATHLLYGSKRVFNPNVFLGPGGIKIFLTVLGGRPALGQDSLVELLLLPLREVLPWRGHQRGVNDLASPSQ